MKPLARGPFLAEKSNTTETQQKSISRILLAAASVGLFASLMLTPKIVTNQSTPSGELASTSATAKVLKRCNLELPTVQLNTVAKSLDEWSPVWLATNAAIPNDEQNSLCAQLLGASLQGPSEGESPEQPAFEVALEETKQLMIIQIADQVMADGKVAEDLAPLMGLTPVDVQHYFKSVKKGSPAAGPGPTPEVGPYFSV